MRLNCYRIGDVLGGALLGAAIATLEHAVSVDSIFWPVRFVFMMLIAMIVQGVFVMVFGSLLGNVEIAVPSFVTAMLAMFIPDLTTDFSQQVSLGALVGANVFAAFELWDMALRGRQLKHPRSRRGWRVPGKVRCWWYDFRQYGGNRRRAWIQKDLLAEAQGAVLFAGAGTGLNLIHLKGRDDLRILAVDMDSDFMEVTRRRASALGLAVNCMVADLERLDLDENTIDTVVSIATLCSIASPRIALAEYRRVLKPGGKLLLFEHVRSHAPLVGSLMAAMDRMQSRSNPSMVRETVDDVKQAGFEITSVLCGFGDVYLAIYALNSKSEAAGIPVRMGAA